MPIADPGKIISNSFMYLVVICDIPACQSRYSIGCLAVKCIKVAFSVYM